MRALALAFTLTLALAFTPHATSSGAVIAVVDRLEGEWIVLITESGVTLDVPCGPLCDASRAERIREGSWVIYWPKLSWVEPLRSEGSQEMTERLRRRVSKITPLE
jgi:hypothetical protein